MALKYFDSTQVENGMQGKLIVPLKSLRITRKPGSGRPKTACTQENIDDVVHLSLSQDDTPGTHKSQRDTVRRLKIGKGSVHHILKTSGLKSVKRLHMFLFLLSFQLIHLIFLP